MLPTVVRIVISLAVTAGVGYLNWTLLCSYHAQRYSLWWTAPGWLVAVMTLVVATADEGILVALPASLVGFLLGASVYFQSRERTRYFREKMYIPPLPHIDDEHRPSETARHARKRRLRRKHRHGMH